MKTLKLAALFSLIALTVYSNNFITTRETDKTLESRSLPSVEDIEFPLYHIVYDYATDLFEISLDPQYVNYNPGNYTYIVMYMDVETPEGFRCRYSWAFPMKGRCWADMTRAYIGEYEVWLELDGVEFNRTTFSIPNPFDNRYRDGILNFQTSTFGN